MNPVYDPTKSAKYLRAALLKELGFGTCHIITNDEQCAMSAQRKARQSAEPYDSQWSVTPASEQQDQSHCSQPYCSPSRRHAMTGRG